MSLPSNSQRCVECRSDLAPGAKKCTVCGSFQDWRRHISYSQSAIALALSIIAIVTSFWEPIREFYSSWGVVDDSRFRAVGARVSPAELSFLAVNDSQESVLFDGLICDISVLRDPSLFFSTNPQSWPDQEAVLAMFRHFYILEEPVLIRPGESQWVAFAGNGYHVHAEATNTMRQWESAVPNFCVLDTTDSAGNEGLVLVELSFFDLLFFSPEDEIEGATFWPPASISQADLRESISE